MLKRLRFQLTFLYTLVALSLVLLTGIGSYSLLKYYYQKETDLALQYKMATQFRGYGLTPPPELVQAEQNWQAVNPRPPTVNKTQSIPSQPAVEGDGEEDEESEAAAWKPNNQPGEFEEGKEESYDGQLASIYVLPLDARGEVIENAKTSLPVFSQDEEASHAALTSGQDLRTTRLDNGARVRLLTYRTASPAGPVLLQVGRTLVDQERVLKRFLWGLLILGSIASGFLGLGSWWLSGRSLSPAQRAWDQQQAFISNASHELRTPLTLIKASAEVGLRSQTTSEDKEMLRDILGESDYMDRLVDDLLLLSRLDTQRLKLARQSISLAELLEEAAHQAEKLINGKGIQLEVGEASGTIWGDRMRMRQVLLILLDNAVRFTPHGGEIRLETGVRQKMRQVIVSDNGSGIAAEHLAHVFERFYQVNPPDEALTRSNGLGLSIARGIIEAQGGLIKIESRAGNGTRVVIEMPAA